MTHHTVDPQDHTVDPQGLEGSAPTPPPLQSHGVEHILHVVQHLEHLLPGQAVITDFVHHNTLHGFQKLAFPQALAAARQVTGIYGYLPAARFRDLLQQGRITRDDLETIIANDPELASSTPLGPTKQGEVIRLLLEHDIKPLTATQLAWEITERHALTRLQPGVNTTPLLQTPGEAEAVTNLWQTCLELFGLRHDDWYREMRLDLAAEETFSFPTTQEMHADRAAQEPIIERIRQEADQLWKDLDDRVGVTWTFRELLHTLTGTDILEELRPWLLRTLAAFLDLGTASWPLPNRHLGLYTAWRESARHEVAFALEEMPHWRSDIEELPETALATVEACLTRMGLPEERWSGYLERLAMELPGWSGMILWRNQRPNYRGMTVRVELLDYLAVRLVMERLFAARLCRTLWLQEPSLPTLKWYFHHHRGELWCRWSLGSGVLPEFLAMRAKRLLQRPPADPGLLHEWQKLAFAIWTTHPPDHQPAACPTGGGKAWPLFVLAQHLGMDGAAVRRGGLALAEEMLACLAKLTDEKSGYLWLQAYERHYRNQIFAALTANHGRGRWAKRDKTPTAQIFFCMDDREEGIRRHLEEHTATVETLGAAGFFGIPVNWLGLDDTAPSPLCPVVVTPAHTVHEHPVPGSDTTHRQRQRRRAWRLRGQNMVFSGSHRGFILPTMLSVTAAPLALLALLGKLMVNRHWGTWIQKLRHRFDGPTHTSMTLTAHDDGIPATPQQPRMGFTDAEQAGRVAGFLRMTGLTYGFAPVVAILGHGSSSQNNPHLAAYDCGACSGRHGGPNARLFAAMANRPVVRDLLRTQGIDIPAETWFIGGEHNTGNETIEWFDRHLVPAANQAALARVIVDLDSARAGSAHERTRRLASAPRRPTPARALAHMVGRGTDCSQARPELGHATNAVALIGRRSVSQGAFFDRRLFLISYDPTQDPDGRIVEGILLAAGPVGAGISLEYYFSTVDNDRYGCGTKVVHNLTGLFGVMEGTSSDLRTGLPQQMIEIHEAMRLLVVVEQRPEILTAIYHRQAEIRELVGNAWILLASIDPDSGAIHLFRPESGWVLWDTTMPPVPVVNNSAAWYTGHTGPLAPVLIAQEQAYAA